MKEDVKLWWKQSEADIKTAKHSGEAGDYYAAGFWAQQAVEKGLKALILNKNAEFKKIHDLESLAKEVGADNNVIDKCRKINPAYTIARYPDTASETADSISKEESEELIKLADEVIKWIKGQLKQ